MQIQHQLPEAAALLHVLCGAVRSCGRSRREIARAAGLNKDTMQRVLCGSREITLSEALRILAAAGAPPEPTLLLALFAGQDTALEWQDSEAIAFLGEMFRRLPAAIEGQLGEKISELRPRWGAGAAALVARLLAHHIDELARRDQAFGEAIVPRRNEGREQ
jgi:antitoxin HigA-1